MARKIRAYFMRVDRESGTPYRGYFGEIENELKAKQLYVNFDEPGGLIQCVCIDDIDIICDDEGKLKNFPYNRVWVDADGRVLDIFCGNIMCVRHNSEGEFVSIEESDRETIEKYLLPLDEIITYGNNAQFEKSILPILTVYEESELPEWSENNE